MEEGSSLLNPICPQLAGCLSRLGLYIVGSLQPVGPCVQCNLVGSGIHVQHGALPDRGGVAWIRPPDGERIYSEYLSIHPSIHSSIHPSIHPSIHTYIYTYMNQASEREQLGSLHLSIYTYIHKNAFLVFEIYIFEFLSCFRLGTYFIVFLQYSKWYFEALKQLIPFPTYLYTGFLPGTLPSF